MVFGTSRRSTLSTVLTCFSPTSSTCSFNLAPTNSLSSFTFTSRTPSLWATRRRPRMCNSTARQQIFSLMRLATESASIDTEMKTSLKPNRRNAAAGPSWTDSSRVSLRKLQRAGRNEGIEVDMPIRDLGFNGVPFRSNVFIQPTTDCLMQVVEPPFMGADH